MYQNACDFIFAYGRPVWKWIVTLNLPLGKLFQVVFRGPSKNRILQKQCFLICNKPRTVSQLTFSAGLEVLTPKTGRRDSEHLLDLFPKKLLQCNHSITNQKL